MKTLFILRHAKSSWKDYSLSDFERPLNSRGKKASLFMGELMKLRSLIPEVIVSSPAERAKQTANNLKDSGSFNVEVKYDKRIYGASAKTLLYLISEFDDEFDFVMIVGHNPEFEILVRLLSNEKHRLTTANLAVIDLNIKNWNEVSVSCGNLRALLRPKEEMK